MKKYLLSFMCLFLLVFIASGVSYGWQGRMAGMGDPYGLVQDESDFLINPEKIAQGQGVKFYGDYRFTYVKVTDWDYNLNAINTAGAFTNSLNFDTSGKEYKHNALLGAAFPVGAGRMGVFFTYDGVRGDYDGTVNNYGTINYAASELTKDLDNFALRLLYGLPVGWGNVGFELGIAYRDEKQETWWNTTDMSIGTQNYFWSFGVPERSLLPLMIPYDSKYWELLLKAGTEVKLAPMTIDVSLRGGYILSSDNTYKYLFQLPVGDNTYNSDLNGAVKGWRIGSDIWMRSPGPNPTVTFPVLFSFDYAEKKRDGEGMGTGNADLGELYDYTHKEQSLDIKVGGGVEKKFGSTALIAGGIYYNYLKNKDDFCITRYDSGTSDNGDFPSRQEHRIIMRLVGEKEFSPVVTLRTGLNFFYGWVKEDFKYTSYDSAGVYSYSDDISLKGSRCGIGASLGGTIKLKTITLEPFINGGWQQLRLDGDGEQTDLGLLEMAKSRSEWSIGGGLSVLFGQ